MAVGAVPEGLGQLVAEHGGQLLPILPFAQKALSAAAQIALQRQARLDGRELLGLAVHDAHKALVDKAIEHFVDLGARNIGSAGDVQGLELHVAYEHQIGVRLVRVQADIVQSARLGFQFHPISDYTESARARQASGLRLLADLRREIAAPMVDFNLRSGQA